MYRCTNPVLSGFTPKDFCSVLSPGMCAKCGKQVIGENNGCTAMDQVYHITCFICVNCSKYPVGNSTLLTDNGKRKNLRSILCFSLLHSVLPSSTINRTQYYNFNEVDIEHVQSSSLQFLCLGFSESQKVCKKTCDFLSIFLCTNVFWAIVYTFVEIFVSLISAAIWHNLNKGKG